MLVMVVKVMVSRWLGREMGYGYGSAGNDGEEGK